LEKETDDGYGSYHIMDRCTLADSKLHPDARQSRMLWATKRAHELRPARQEKVNGARAYPLLRKNRKAVTTKWHFF